MILLKTKIELSFTQINDLLLLVFYGEYKMTLINTQIKWMILKWRLMWEKLELEALAINDK